MNANLPDFDALERRAARKPKVRVGNKRDAVPGKYEFEIQADIVKAVRKLGIRATASLNGIKLPGDKAARERKIAHLRRIGMEVGQFDLGLRLPKARGGPAYAELEIKRPGEALTAAQERRAEQLAADGFAHGWACDVPSALAELKRWGWIA